MKINVVNLIPKALSGETSQDSEPNLAVNPINPQQIVATAFTPNPSGGTLAPIFISSNGGQTWALNTIVPGGTMTADITTKFGGSSNVLYGGILRADNLDMNVLRTNDFASSTPMTVLVDRASEDQPWVQATTTTGQSGNVDRVYIGHNDFNTRPRTATVEQSLNAATAPAPAGFGPITIASRIPGAGQNAPSIRPTIHSSGRIYVAYFNWQSFSSTSIVTADVVVCRDDNWGQGGTPYQALIDPGDNLAGVRVAQSVTIPWANNHFLGQERVGSHLSIAVDPNDQNSVFVAWADFPNGVAPYTIHLLHSANAGLSWSADLRTVANGINPALAVNAQGHVGFLYQTLTNAGTVWETHVEISADSFATAPTNVVLASVPSNTPVATFLPYLGDYVYLTALDSTFYGVFSANNAPDMSHFPNGVSYQRNANFTTTTLLNVDNTTPVNVSIDPFFFSIGVLPSVLSVVPNFGPVNGGTDVTISGSGFSGATSVFFGRAAAPFFQVVDDTKITTRSPGSPMGVNTVDVTVGTPLGTSAIVAPDQFDFGGPIPRVESVIPNFGPVNGGTDVTISGSGFSGATSVFFGGAAAPFFQVVDDTKITTRSPGSPMGVNTVDVTVGTPLGTSAIVAPDQFDFGGPIPRVESVIPNFGPVSGGTDVTISGSGFSGATSVFFGGAAAPFFQVVDDTKITTRSPGSPMGVNTVDVTVGTTGGTSAIVAGDQFSFYGN